MRIGELAAELSVSTKTLRHYEKIGLLPTAARAENGYRSFSPGAVRTARLIVALRQMDLSLEALKQISMQLKGNLENALTTPGVDVDISLQQSLLKPL